MKKKGIAVVVSAMILCMAAAGCGAQSQSAGGDGAASGATTAAALATTAEAAAEEDMSWQEFDDAYVTGVKAADYVELPEDYKHIEVEAARPEDPTDDDVEQTIEAELQNRATSEEVDRKVKEGDTVSIDYVGKMDGKEFDGGTGSYDLVIGSNSFVEGFEEGLIGAEKGQTLDIELTFPEDYHPEAGLNGKDVVFTVTVNNIKETKVPELNNDFVKSLNLTNSFGQAVTTVDDYRDYVRSNLIENLEQSYEDTVKSQIVSKLIDESTLKQDPPANMVEKYNYLLKRQLTYYALQSYTDLQTLMNAYYGATEDNYLDMIHDMAKNYAKQGLIFQAIADEHDLNPSEEEVTTAIAGYVADDVTVEKAEDLDRVIRESLRDDLMTDKVIDYLYDHCKVSEPSEEKEDEDAAGASTQAATAEEAAAAKDTSADTAASSDAASTEEMAEEEDNKTDEDKDSQDKDADEKEER